MKHQTFKIVVLITFMLLLSFPSYAQKNLYAGIEIGSKGIKISVLEVNNIKKGNFKILAYWTENISIARGISHNGKLAEEDINRAGIVAFENLTKIKEKFKIADENIFIVASSGVALANNTQDLIDKIKKTTNLELDFIDAEEEGKMLLKGSIPPSEYKDAIILDIGGGNTKGGYIDILNENKFEFFPLQLDYGTVTLTEAINKTIANPKDLEDIEIYKEKSFAYSPFLRDEIKQMLETKPLSLQKNKIYLSGGAIWAFTTLYHQMESEASFIPIKLDEIISYDAVLKNNFNKYENLAKRNKNVAKVIATYNQKHLISANNILIACLESIPDLKSKKIFFAKEGQIAWLVSYVVDRSKKIKTNF